MVIDINIHLVADYSGSFQLSTCFRAECYVTEPRIMPLCHGSLIPEQAAYHRLGGNNHL
jgi:hypothetical protein